MPVRAVEGKQPYTGGKAIEITEDKVINLRLRDENNLIIYDEGDDEIYVDLQLPNELHPTDAFPVGVTTGRAVVDNGWDLAGTILCAKTTSGDNIKLLYADNGTLWIDNGTGTFKQIYFKGDVDAIVAALQSQIDTIMGLGKFLSIWDCTTGLPDSFPLEIPYEYSTGDWYLVGVVDSTTNYRPNGSSFTGVASQTVETELPDVNDVYIYDGTNWMLQRNSGIGGGVSFAQITGQPTDNTNLANALGAKADSSSLATVATSGDYDDLLDKPNLATVATTGDYDDLLNKPTIPAAQVQSDWGQSDNTKVDYIKNKPSLATVATTGDYTDLTNKPTIPAAQVNSDWNASSGVAEILNKPTIPTDTSDLTNGAGFITGITSTDVTTALGYTPYDDTNPDGYITGITSSDVTTALGYTPYNSSNPSGYTSNTGDVVGPSSAVDGNVAVFDQTTGKLIKDGNIALSTLSAGASAGATAVQPGDLGTAAACDTGTSSGNVPVLDSNGKLATTILPGVALTDTFTVTNVSDLTSLTTAEQGDIGIVTSESKTYVLSADPYSTAANWKELLSPTDAVTSVNSMTGAVTLDADDISDSTTTNKFVTALDKTNWNGLNTKTFTLSSTSDLVNAQAAFDWIKNGKNAILRLATNNREYPFLRDDSSSLIFMRANNIDVTDATGSASIIDAGTITLYYSGNTVTSIVKGHESTSQSVLLTNLDYSTPYTPTYDGSPTTKKYVDNKVTYVGSSAPSSPTEGRLWYDTTNDVLKSYDGSNWKVVGNGDVTGPSSSTDGHLAVFDGVTGKLIKDGGAIPSTADCVKTSGDQTIAGTKTFSTSPVVPSKTSDATNTGTAIATEAQVYKKQDTLVNQTNIKSINGNSLLGSGDLTVSGLPAGGTTGQILMMTANGPAWVTPADNGFIMLSSTSPETVKYIWAGTEGDYTAIGSGNYDVNTRYDTY